MFSEILDLGSPNTREKYLLKTKCLDFFSLQATAVDRCGKLREKKVLDLFQLFELCGKKNREKNNKLLVDFLSNKSTIYF